jgi:thioredoxin-related protein
VFLYATAHGAQNLKPSSKSQSKAVANSPIGPTLHAPISDIPTEFNSIIDHFPSLQLASTNENFDFKNFKSKFSTWIVFQKSCKTCHTMMREHKCYKAKNNHVSFVGILAEPEALVKAAQEQSSNLNILYSKTDLVAHLKLDVTPTVFIFKDNQLVHRHDNYMSCKAIKTQILKHKLKKNKF